MRFENISFANAYELLSRGGQRGYVKLNNILKQLLSLL
jgi:hypothetical protein